MECDLSVIVASLAHFDRFIVHSFVMEWVSQVSDQLLYLSKQLKDLVANFRSTLSEKSLGTQGSAIAFTRLLRKVRESDQPTVQAVLKDKKNARIL